MDVWFFWLEYFFANHSLVALYIRHFKGFALPLWLKAVGQAEGIVHIVMLENVQAAVDWNLPAIITYDVACMDGVLIIKFPIEINAGGLAGIFDFTQVLFLLIASEVVFCGEQILFCE